jgi:serine/threonine protein phosphatase PrpC
MFTVLHHSEPGGHVHNEDAFAVTAHPRDPSCLLGAVADGQGGQPRGGPAARLACRAVLDAAAALPTDRLLVPGTWEDLLSGADQAVAADPGAGLTTLVAFAVRGDALAGASSGDSAAVALDGRGASTILTARQLKNPPVGSGAAEAVGFACLLTRPWTVLALTDGVWKYAGWPAVLEAMRLSAEAVVPALRARAVLPGSGALPDDFTALLVRS